ncbi:MAG: MFS transporter [Chloroflexi bacterium]|nr:MFS transporter [Chloroflexota bacterium]
MTPPTGRYVLLATILGSSMAFIDGSALNVVLSVLQVDLGASGAQLVWVVNAYLLMLASLILIGGSLGDNYGRNRVFGAGIAIFAGASVACGLAPSAGVLIAARAVQGIGGALMVPGSLAIITANFHGDSRGPAIGIWSSFSTITTVGGPVLGGLLGDVGLWRGVFFINVPLALVALWALRRVPETRSEDASGQIDIPGAACVTLGLAGLTYGLVTLGDLGPQAGLRDPGVIGALIVGVAALIAFVVIERRVAHPMVDLTLFRSRAFSGANLMTAFLYGALSGGLLFLPLNLIQVQGYGPGQAGLVMLPFAGLLAILSPWAGRWGARVGPRVPLTIGPALVALGFVALALPGITAGASEYWTTYLPGIVLLGAGMGITVAPLTSTVMGAVPERNAGIASGINNAVTRSSQALMTGVFGAVALVLFASTLQTNAAAVLPPAAADALVAGAGDLAATAIPDSLSPELAEVAQNAIHESFVQVFQVLMVVCAGLCFASAVFSAAILRGTRRGAGRGRGIRVKEDGQPASRSRCRTYRRQRTERALDGHRRQ